jgi:hypothetical protein
MTSPSDNLQTSISLRAGSPKLIDANDRGGVGSRCRHVVDLGRIRDNGTGIPTEVRDRIFDPFFTSHHDQPLMAMPTPSARHWPTALMLSLDQADRFYDRPG